MGLKLGDSSLILDFFLSENPDWYLFDGFTEEDLRKEITDWSVFYDDNNMLAFLPKNYNIVEIHGYSKEGNRKSSITFMEECVKLLDMQFNTIFTYVPVKFRGTINFLTKRLGFEDHGECATRNYGGKEVKVNLLMRNIR